MTKLLLAIAALCFVSNLMYGFNRVVLGMDHKMAQIHAISALFLGFIVGFFLW